MVKAAMSLSGVKLFANPACSQNLIPIKSEAEHNGEPFCGISQILEFNTITLLDQKTPN